MSAFKLYDTHRHGYIDAKQLRYILTNTGEKLTDKDGTKRKIILINNLFFSALVDLILRELNVSSDGRVFYDNLVHMLTQPLAGRR
jgi:Ca2+-binding EF-hand superfamily protein